MKRVTFHARKGILKLPGDITLTAGESRDVSDDIADSLARQPHLPITITDTPQRAKRPESQPEAHEGEGQPTAHDQEEE